MGNYPGLLFDLPFTPVTGDRQGIPGEEPPVPEICCRGTPGR
jgi:hypothetical protein